MKIAVIGIGNVGGTLGRRWARMGHRVTFGVRDPDSAKVRKLLSEAGDNALAASVRAAAADADVVVLAVPWREARAAIQDAGDLAGKVLVDCTNPIAPGLQLALGTTTSGAEQVGGWAKGAQVVKAFNTTGFENMANPLYGGERTAMLICGNDADAKRVVSKLIEELGFVAVDTGSLREGGRKQQPGSPIYNRTITARDARAALASM
jgi:predicted dinucleotide-binding enzyme